MAYIQSTTQKSALIVSDGRIALNLKQVHEERDTNRKMLSDDF
jgi:hypothetical protein